MSEHALAAMHSMAPAYNTAPLTKRSPRHAACGSNPEITTAQSPMSSTPEKRR
jgi:hypothetical protein